LSSGIEGRRVKHFHKALTAAIVSLFLSACSGGSTEETAENVKKEPGIVPRGVVQPAAAPPDASDRPTPRKSTELPKKVEARKQAKVEDKNAIDPNADPRDVFIVDGNGLHFDDGGPGSKHEPTDEFAAILPEAPDPTLFEVQWPERTVTTPDKPKTLPPGFTPIASEGYSDSGWPLRIRCEKDQSIMVLVPAGTSPIGSNDGPSESSPQLTVYLDDFYIDMTEVTVGQWEVFRQGLRDDKKRPPQESVNASASPDFPALGIPYSEAVVYASRAGKDLPNEAEWEKAARGEKGFPFAWGTGRPIWSRPRTVNQIDPVKSFRTDLSVYGVYDLAGNAQEWCSDFYSATHYSELAYSGSVVRSWRGPRRSMNENVRVVRGGGPNWEASHRRGLSSRERDPVIGFRCVLHPNEKPAPTAAESPTKSDRPSKSLPLPSTKPSTGSKPLPTTPRKGSSQ
jgi:hypothetical protein